MEKFGCLKCKEIATWFYMPAERKQDWVYCDIHVPRGCSCNEDEHGHEAVNEKGRLYPCCEYDYDVSGWDKSLKY